MKTNNKGFSLVELIVVIAIMAILAAVAIPTFSGFITKAKISNDVSFVNDVTYAAKIATVEYEGDVTVTVEVAANGAVNKITVNKVSGENVTFSAVLTSASVTSSSDSTAASDIKGSIDWDYTFDNYTNGTYQLGSDGKTLTK